MKRNKKNIREKRLRNDEDKFDRNKRRKEKLDKKSFPNQYEHELYLDNLDYYDEPNTIEDFQTQ
jgi:hypothetical protein